MENPSQNKSQCVVVLGSPRSGTSMTAGLLDILGVDMGNLRPSDSLNARGYYEDKDFLNLINSLYSKVSKECNGLNPPSQEEIMTIADQFERRIKELIK